MISHLAVFHINQVTVLLTHAQHNVMMVANSQHSLRLRATQMFVLMKNQSRTLYTHTVMYKLLSQSTMISKFTAQVSMNTLEVHIWVDMLLHSLVMVKKTVQSTGKSKTHGVLHGVKKVASELSEVLMNVVLKNLVIKVITEYFQNLNFLFYF